MSTSLTARAIGQQQEDIAATFLKQQHAIIMARNVACRFGEIDLIIRDHGILAFVEVRFRRHTAHGTAAVSVDRHKQQRIIKTAQWYLKNHPREADTTCRFDVLAISNNQTAPIDWIKDAFRIEDSF